MGAESWLGFLDLWSGQKPWWNRYLTPVVNFGEVLRAHNILILCIEHSADRNSSSDVPDVRPHGHYLLQEFGWEVFHHPPFSPDLASSDFHLLLHLIKFLSGQRFQNEREAEMIVTVIPLQAADFYDMGYKSWSHGMTNISVPEVNMLEIAQHFLNLFK